MQTKRKISLTIDENIFSAIEVASKTHNMAKSHIAQKAFELWLKKETELLMAKGYEEMAEEDQLFAEKAFDAQTYDSLPGYQQSGEIVRRGDRIFEYYRDG